MRNALERALNDSVIDGVAEGVVVRRSCEDDAVREPRRCREIELEANGRRAVEPGDRLHPFAVGRVGVVDFIVDHRNRTTALRQPPEEVVATAVRELRVSAEHRLKRVGDTRRLRPPLEELLDVREWWRSVRVVGVTPG